MHLITSSVQELRWYTWLSLSLSLSPPWPVLVAHSGRAWQIIICQISNLLENILYVGYNYWLLEPLSRFYTKCPSADTHTSTHKFHYVICCLHLALCVLWAFYVPVSRLSGTQRSVRTADVSVGAEHSPLSRPRTVAHRQAELNSNEHLWHPVLSEVGLN